MTGAYAGVRCSGVQDMRRLFASPPAEFRSLTFWSWNELLDREKLEHAVETFKDAGMGGFFMHARAGLAQRFLSDHWFTAVRSCVSAARTHGLQAWIYDELGWPSGAAAGAIAAMSEQYRAMALVCHVSRHRAPIAESLARCVVLDWDGPERRTAPWTTPDFGEAVDRRYVQFYPWRAPLGHDDSVGGTSYIDTLNPEAVEAFIGAAYNTSEQAVGRFDASCPGFFTDEPSFGFGRTFLRGRDGAWPLAIPWTPDLPARFEAAQGYSLMECLPHLFFDVPGAYRTRHDFWSLASQLFVEAWTKQIRRWCDAHGAQLVGHLNGEDSLLEQLRWSAGVMRHYAHFDIPGIDKLGRNVDASDPLEDCDGNLVGIKQVESVAAQLGKPRVLCEAFGGAGHAFGPKARWWHTNWMSVLGVSLFNPHLTPVSIKGFRKRDYPPVISSHQPWWPASFGIETAFARQAAVLSQGKRCVDVLVVHPLASAWATYTPGGCHAVRTRDQRLLALCSALMGQHVDFHFGDEHLMREHGRADAAGLHIGRHTYRVVLLPELLSIGEATVRLLVHAAGEGVVVATLGSLPTLVDGREQPSDLAEAVSTHLDPGDYAQAARELAAIVLAAAPQSLKVDGSKHIWKHHRRIDDGSEVLFLANIDPDRSGTVEVAFADRGCTEEWSIDDGAVRVLGGDGRLSCDIPPMSSRLFVRSQSAVPMPSSAPTAPVEETTIDVSDGWLAASEASDLENVLVLDSCELSIGDYVWKDIHTRAACSLLKTAGVGTQYMLRYTFDAAAATHAGLSLAFEQGSERWSINGRLLGPPTGPWIDSGILKHAIGPWVRGGSNVVEVAGTVCSSTEVEAIYVLGSFKVAAVRLRKTVESAGVRFGSWQVAGRLSSWDPTDGFSIQDAISSGCPFFAGHLRLLRSIEVQQPAKRALLVLEDVDAAAVAVRCNSDEMAVRCWPPYVFDLSPVWRQGENRLELTLMTTLRNVFGPFHHDQGDPPFVAPTDFVPPRGVTHERWLAPLGVQQVRLELQH